MSEIKRVGQVPKIPEKLPRKQPEGAEKSARRDSSETPAPEPGDYVELSEEAKQARREELTLESNE